MDEVTKTQNQEKKWALHRQTWEEKDTNKKANKPKDKNIL